MYSRALFLAFSAAGLSLAATTAHAQAAPADSLAGQLRRYVQATPTEALYVHHDRPAYAAGETMWLKLYATDGTTHRPLALSQVAYVEVLDARQQPVLQAKLALRHAVGQGTLTLPASLPTGRYVLRAYTNWMKNAGPNFYFQAPLPIVNTWQPAPAPAASSPAPGPEVQFFPEGGQLVQGLPGRLGFKATDAYGRGLAVAGTIADEHGTTVATLQSLKAGLGSVAFTPQPGMRYTASLRLATGQVLRQLLPAAAATGYALQLEVAGPALSLRVATNEPGARSLYLLAHTGRQVHAAVAATVAGGAAEFRVDARQLPAGITHFTVFSGRRPVAERLYFRRPGRALVLRGATSAAAYGLRQAVGVQLQAGQAAAASVAVYRLDSLAASQPATDLAAYLLLAADLPGYVEDAGYYLRDSTEQGRQAADNLMLTQGWRRFRWEAVLQAAPPAPAYPLEASGYLLQAHLSRPDGSAPPPNTVAYLSLPGRGFWFGNAASTADGRVRFEVPNLYGLRKLVLQPNYTTADSALRVELLPPFTAGGSRALPALPALPQRWAASLSERHLAVQARQAFGEPAAVLRPVPADTVPFYGSRPDEHYRLDDYTRFPTVEDVMREYVPGVLVRKRADGFHFRVVDRPQHSILKENPLTLIDGLPIFNINQIMAFDPLKIKELDVMANRYFLSSQSYEGVVSYRTYQSDLGGFTLNPHALIEEYEGLQVPREFYAPRYDSPERQRSRLPDLRNLLYWNPNVPLAATPQQLSFFTGDQPGRYLVVVQGLSDDGLPGSTSFSFEVKPAL